MATNFRDRLTGRIPGARDLVRLMRSGGFRPSLADLPHIPVRPVTALPELPAGDVGITWVGHATYVIRIGHLTVLTDPVWASIPGVKRLTPPGLAWKALPHVDAVVISHNHYDHLDAPTLRRLPRDTAVFVPLGLERWFRRRGFTQVTELDWWQSRELGGVHFDLVPAHHWSRRTPFDTCRTLWGGWVLTADDGARVYFAGDTGYGHFFGEIGARHPGIQLALMPVGAYAPRWFMHSMHMNPEEAVRACDDLGAPRMSTMHWGTFPLSREPLLEPVEGARAAWADAGRDPADLWDMAIGDSRSYGEVRSGS